MSVRQMPMALMATRTLPGGGDSGSGGACQAEGMSWHVSCVEVPRGCLNGEEFSGNGVLGWESRRRLLHFAHLLEPQVVDTMQHCSIVAGAVVCTGADVSKMLQSAATLQNR